MKKKPLVILTGPTAVGKTDLSIKLAKKINGEIISADSIQVYKYMDIGSAKITEEEMCGIKHYLIDELYPNEEFNIFRFKQMAMNAMEEIYSKGKIPIITGGTGFYIQALLYDVEFSEEDDTTSVRKELEDFVALNGPEALFEILKECDPESAQTIHMNNVKRVIRAVEFYKLTGQKISEHNKEQMAKESPYNFKYFIISRDRDEMYKRIDKRVDIMIENGLVAEVKKLLDLGYDRNLVSMQGLGYKEIVSYILGEITLEEAIYIIKRDTRHFAKRQLTWFKREKVTEWLDYKDYNNDIDCMCEEMYKRCIDSFED